MGAESEELQLLGQPFGAVMVLQHHVDGLAQRRQEGLLELVAMAQAGAGQALHQAIDVGDQLAAQAPAIGIHRLQRLADALGKLAMLGLFETLGKAQQAQIGFAELGQVVTRPLAALQALPYLEDLASLMNYPLGKVVLEALTAGVF
jgi:hypothetical protein